MTTENPTTSEHTPQSTPPRADGLQQETVDRDGRPPLWAPHHGVSFGGAVARFFKKYATFNGRASRSEFWWATLMNVAVTFVLLGAALALRFATIQYDTVDFGDGAVYRVARAPEPWFWVLLLLPAVWGLAVLVPSLALGWRRLHDANLSGALWIIALFVNVVGLVFGLLPSNPQGARFDRPEGAR